MLSIWQTKLETHLKLNKASHSKRREGKPGAFDFKKPGFANPFGCICLLSSQMRLKTALPTVLLFALCGQAAAQTQILPPVRPYRVLSYKLLLDWRRVFTQKTQLFSGHNKISVELTDATSSIVLDAAEMNIDSVR